MKRPRILLADDHKLMAEALQHLLQTDFDVVGTVSDGRALIKAAAELKPELVIVDIAMPLLNGLDAADQLKAQHPEIKVIFLTQNREPRYAVEAFRRKASGYLLKDSAASELTAAGTCMGERLLTCRTGRLLPRILRRHFVAASGFRRGVFLQEGVHTGLHSLLHLWAHEPVDQRQDQGMCDATAVDGILKFARPSLAFGVAAKPTSLPDPAVSQPLPSGSRWNRRHQIAGISDGPN